MKDKFKISLFSMMVILLAAAGCSLFTTKGTLILHLTDAPIILENQVVTEVNVTITKVIISRGTTSDDAEITEGTTSEEVNALDGPGDAEWITIFEEERPFNLLELQDGITEILGTVELEPGRYNQIRLIVDTDNTIKFEGDEILYGLKIPSGTESGVKITGGFNIETGKDLEITLDFDAAESIHPRSGGSDYILQPVIRVQKVTKSK